MAVQAYGSRLAEADLGEFRLAAQRMQAVSLDPLAAALE